MTLKASLFASALALATMSEAYGQEPSSSPPTISIAVPTAGDWRVSYRSETPMWRLLFQRSPDDSRRRKWGVEPGFEIVSSSDGEIARRLDGQPFRTVQFTTAPTYLDLPKDYAPFSPFGDGGIAFHTGRFFACADTCSDDPRWSMSLSRTEPARILVSGASYADTARWTDRDSGQMVYIGNSILTETEQLVAVFDGSLPQPIRQQLAIQLPQYIEFFARKLGPLSSRPMLLASYDAAHTQGWGRQGGTLPGQVFVHFYGNRWPDEMRKPDFANDLSWHFAHEAGHVYQRQFFVSAAPWIHEGGAEALASIAVRETGLGSRDFVDRRVAKAKADCASSTRDSSISSISATGDVAAAYSCGLVINLAIDAEVRRAAPTSDGLYSIWREFISHRGAQQEPSEDDFFAAVSAVGGPDLAARLRYAIQKRAPNLDVVLP